MIKIAAIIPTFNRKKKLSIILKQLQAQVFQKKIFLEIVVVIDGSSDGTLEMIKTQYPTVHVVLGNGNWWYTKSMNKGFQYAQKLSPDFILTINDDVVARVVLDLRRKAYGTWESQLEKINDDGIDSWKLDGAAVKAKFPK